MNKTLKKGTDRVRGKGDEEEGGGRGFPVLPEWGLIGPGPLELGKIAQVWHSLGRLN